jgi:hypothetical protein
MEEFQGLGINVSEIYLTLDLQAGIQHLLVDLFGGDFF